MRPRFGFSLPAGEPSVRYGNQRMRTTFLTVLLVFAALFAACGGGEEGVAPGAQDGVSDEEYLEALCTGLQRFSAALIAQSSPEELRNVIASYTTDMEAIVPPRDVSQFHLDYIAFLQAAESEPALMVAGSPPMPPEPARSRIASKENTVEACKDPIYFGQPANQ